MERGDKLKTLCRWVAKVMITLISVTFLSFVLMKLAPIDPAETYIRLNSIVVDEVLLMQLREEMGLNQPLLIQYGNWVRDIMQLNFGTSLVWKKPVLELISFYLPKSLLLLLLSIVFQGVVSVLAGYFIYINQRKKSNIIYKLLLVTGIAIPSFLIAIFALDLFGARLGVISITQSGYLLPAICIGIAPSCFYTKMIVGGLNIRMEEPWVDYSRTRGLSESWILKKQALPLVIRSLIPSFLQSAGRILAGMGIVEAVFSFDGFGSLLFRSIIQRDTPVIHAAVLILAIIVLIFDIWAEIIRKQLITTKLRSKEVNG